MTYGCCAAANKGGWRVIFVTTATTGIILNTRAVSTYEHFATDLAAASKEMGILPRQRDARHRPDFKTDFSRDLGKY